MHFSDLVVGPFAVVREIYERLELPMSEEAGARIRAFISDNPRGKYGAHRYTPEESGVDPSAIRDAFASYIERFDLQPE